jgi:putative PIN family toxin of toxin-antitoxin system
MKRVVIDTNVLVAGLRSRQGASFQLLMQIAARKLTPLVSISLFLEYEAVLKRPEQLAANGFKAAEIDQFLAEIAALAEPVETHFLWRPQLSDANDELVLEAAVNGRADALVTHNLRDFERASERFRLNVVRPADVLKGPLR